MKQSELTVITHAKDLCRYILTVTEKSPKRFRFTLVSRLQNLTFDCLEEIYRANEVYMGGHSQSAVQERLEHQHKALTAVKLTGYMALLAREQSAILPRQYEQISKQVSNVQNLLGAWINSDRKRFASTGAKR